MYGRERKYVPASDLVLPGLHKTGVGRSEQTPQRADNFDNQNAEPQAAIEPWSAVNLGNENAESTAKTEPNWTEMAYLSCISNRRADPANQVSLGEMHKTNEVTLGHPDGYTPPVTEGEYTHPLTESDLLQHTTTSPGSRGGCGPPFLGSGTLNKTEVWAVEKVQLIARLEALEAKELEAKHRSEVEELLHKEKTTFALFKEIGHNKEAGENFHTYSICRATGEHVYSTLV